MSRYTDIFVGFIDKDDTPAARKKGCTDNVMVNRIYIFFKDYCIIQYVENSLTNYTIGNFHYCRFCNDAFRNVQLVYYDGLTRYIFPDYLYHYIKHHHIQFDEKLITIVNSINGVI
jgi:hypothetical protein